MNTADTAGLCLLILALCVSAVVGLYVALKNENERSKSDLQFISILVQLMLFPIAIVPQLIVNTENDGEITQTYSPYFVVVYPVSVVFDILNHIFVKQYEERTWNEKFKIVAMNVRLILYIAWLIQFYNYQKDVGFLVALIVFFIVVGLSFVYIVKDRVLRTPPKTSGSLF